MCPKGRNDFPKDISLESFDLILEPGERLHVVSPLSLILLALRFSAETLDII